MHRFSFLFLNYTVWGLQICKSLNNFDEALWKGKIKISTKCFHDSEIENKMTKLIQKHNTCYLRPSSFACDKALENDSMYFPMRLEDNTPYEILMA